MRLGISAEALRRRLERGEVLGFERDGTSFVYVNDLPAKDFGAGRRFGGAAAESPPRTPPDGTLPVVVEFQKMELTRLLRENERLNTRLDQLFDEIRHLRDMQQREQVLRQQEQALRRQNQETLDRLTSRPALPAPSPPRTDPPEPDNPRSELVLTRTVVTKRPTAKPPTAKPPSTKPPGKTQAKPTHRPESGFLATGREGVAGPDRREPHAIMPKPRPGKPVTRGFAATPTPAPTPTAASREVQEGAIGPEEAAELAVILNDIGHSLRDSEAFRRYPPIKPGSIPQRAGDRRPASARRSAAETLSAEEAALVAIFDSMGPTAEDRRTAARNVRRLLRSHVPPPAGEP